MSLFLSFLGGAAEQFTESLKESEKTAKAEAALRTKALYEGYAEVVKNNRKLESDLRADVDFVKSFKPDATEDQISAIVFNRPVMEAVKKHFKDNPEAAKDFDITTFTGLTNQNASPFTAAQRIESYLKLPKATKEVDTVADGTGFFDRVAGKQRKSAETQMAAALGVSMEEMRGARGFVPTAPDLGAKFDMGLLNKPKELKQVKDKVELAMNDAMETGDEAKIDKASKDLARIVAIEEKSKTEKKTEAQIQSDMITQIQSETDPNKAKLLTQQLRQRQFLAKTLGEGKGKGDEVTTNNLISTATKQRDSILTQMLPPGSFVTVVDPRTGESSTQIKDLASEAQYRKGVETAHKAIIRDSTGPNGLPLSEGHKVAMRAVGINFDDTGRPYPTLAAPAVVRKGAVDLTNTEPEVPPQMSVKPAAKPAATTTPTTTSQSVTVNGKMYNRPSNFTDAQWDAYKKTVGAK